MLSKYPLVTVAVRNGILAAFLGVGFFLGLYFMGRHPLLIPVYFDFRIILFGVFIVFTLKEYRDYFQQGTLYFAQGMMMSLLFTLVFSIVSFFLIWAFAAASDKFVSSYVTLTLEQMKTIPPEIIERIGRGEYERNLTVLPSTRALDLAELYLSQSFAISLFLSIIISVILRRQPKP